MADLSKSDNKAPPRIRLSDTQVRSMRWLKAGLPIDYGIRGRSQHGGFDATVKVLRRLGLIDSNGRLTEQGWYVADQIPDA